MPPKTKAKKAGKGKSSSVADDVSTGEMSKEQMWEYAVRLQEELDRVREEKRYFQLERDKAEARLEISKKNLEEVEAHQRNKRRQREEARGRHQAQITIYKEKLRHILSEQNNMISELKMDGASSCALIQNQHTEEELALSRDVQDVQAEFNERRLHQENLIQELKLKHQMELMEIKRDYECRVQGIQAKYDELKLSMVMEEEKTMLMKLWSEDTKIDIRLESLKEELTEEMIQLEVNLKGNAASVEKLIKEITQKQQRNVMKSNKDPKRRCQENNVTCSERSQSGVREEQRRTAVAGGTRGGVASLMTVQGEQHDQLQEELKENEAQTSKKLSDARQESEGPTEAQRKLQQKHLEQQKHLQEAKQGRDMMVVVRCASKRRAHLKTLEKELRELTVEQELLLQACEKVERERDELLQRQTESILDVQRKSGLQKMLLERKLAAVAEDVEKAEAQLCGVLAVSSLDPTQRSNAAGRLEEIMSCKQAIMDRHQEDLDRECEEYDELVRTHKERLQASGALLHDLSFRSSKEILKAAPVKP